MTLARLRVAAHPVQPNGVYRTRLAMSAKVRAASSCGLLGMEEPERLRHEDRERDRHHHEVAAAARAQQRCEQRDERPRRDDAQQERRDDREAISARGQRIVREPDDRAGERDTRCDRCDRRRARRRAVRESSCRRVSGSSASRCGSSVSSVPNPSSGTTVHTIVTAGEHDERRVGRDRVVAQSGEDQEADRTRAVPAPLAPITNSIEVLRRAKSVADQPQLQSGELPSHDSS